MKKTGLAGIAVLLAFAVAACGGFLTDPEDSVKLGFDGYNEQGQEMVVVGIGGGEGRALTDTPLRQNKATFYEVAFKNGTNVYRTSWNEGYAATIRIPVGTYATAADAILFAGTPDGTLLAVGLLTQVNGAAGTTINTSTTSITFTVESLVNGIVTTVANSTFTSVDFVNSEMADPGVTFKTPSTLPNTPIHPFAINDPISAVYQICVGGTGAGNLSATYNAGIYVDLTAVAGTYAPFSIRNSTFNGATSIAPFTALSITSPTTNTFPANGEFTLGFTTPSTAGFAELYLTIKAYAMNGSTSPTGVAALDWFIKGGLSNNDLDEGAAIDSEGAALLLTVGTAQEMVDVGINDPTF